MTDDDDDESHQQQQQRWTVARGELLASLCMLESLLDEPSFHLNDVLERLRNQVDLRAEIEKQERAKQQPTAVAAASTSSTLLSSEELVNRWRDMFFDCLEHFKRMCQAAVGTETAAPHTLAFLDELKEAVRAAKEKLEQLEQLDVDELVALRRHVDDYLHEYRQIIVCYRVCEFLEHPLNGAAATTTPSGVVHEDCSSPPHTPNEHTSSSTSNSFSYRSTTNKRRSILVTGDSINNPQ